MTENNYTRGIAEFVSGLAYDAIPDEVRQRIKLLILDAVLDLEQLNDAARLAQLLARR